MNYLWRKREKKAKETGEEGQDLRLEVLWRTIAVIHAVHGTLSILKRSYCDGGDESY